MKESSSTPVIAAVIDTLLVLTFVLIGRASHGENLLGTLTTFWPFLVGLAIGWVIARAWRAPLRVARTGILLWAATLAIGMLLRVVSGQGIQVSFVIVAAIVLGVFLIGWRAIAKLVLRPRRSRA